MTPEDYLARERQRAMEASQLITLPSGTQYRYGDRNPMSSPIQPPGQPSSSVTPPTGVAQSVPGLPQIASQLGQGQFPMPGQLGAAAQQSSLFGNNWASLFNQQ